MTSTVSFHSCKKSSHSEELASKSLHEIQGELEKTHKNLEDLSVDTLREEYQKIFQTLKNKENRLEQSLDLRNSLYTLFYYYAVDCCYAIASKEKDSSGKPIDPHEGFRKTARLLELSVLMQLEDMDLYSSPFDWKSYTGLEDMIQNLGFQDSDPAVLEMCRGVLKNTNLEVLMQKIGTDKQILHETLLKLSASHQNVPSLCEKNDQNIAHHQALDRWAETLIGDATAKDRLNFAEYKYNRIGLWGTMLSQDPETRIAAYDEVLEMFRKDADPNDPEGMDLLRHKQAKCLNMQALITNHFFPDDRAHQEGAIDLWTQAKELRLAMTKPTEPKKLWEYEYFLCNLYTGLATTLVTRYHMIENERNSLTQEERNHADLCLGQAKKMAQYMADFSSRSREKGKDHSYFTGYDKCCAQIQKALSQ